MADVNGDYGFGVTQGWSGTVTPSKPGYAFYPPSISYSNVALDTSGQDYTATPTSTYTLQFRSQGGNDGWILESTETSGKGGTKDAGTASFQLGDDRSDRQYRAILSFNTAGLPDNAIVTSAVISIRQKIAPTGTNPFTILGNLLVDIRRPYFGTSPSLQLTDFGAAPSKAKVGTFDPTPDSASWYSAALTPDGYTYINKTNLTQFRLYFSKDDNDNRSADYMKFFSGNALPPDRPLLVITYTLP